MIDKDKNIVQWVNLLYELEDAHEHLGQLIKDMNEEKKGDGDDFCEIDFSIQLAHIYAHLNIAWNTRNFTKDYRVKDRDELRQFPTDLKPS